MPPALAGHSAYKLLAAGPERSRLVLTIFAGGRARVQDTRRADLPAGEARLRFPDVSNMADGTTVQLRALAGGPLEVLEQSYDPGSLAPTKALAAFVGKQVELRIPAEGNSPAKLVKATLVAIKDGPIVQMDGKLFLKPPGEIVLPGMPEGLEPTPTLSWRLKAQGSGTFEAGYMTNGLNWQAHYDLTLAANGSAGRLASWAAVTNDTSAAFPDAHVVAVAGRLGLGIGLPYLARAEAAPAPSAGMGGTPTTQVDEFHRYDLGAHLSLPADQTRQWPLLPERQVSLSRRYRFESYPGGSDAQPRAARVRIEILPIEVPLAGGRYQIFGDDGTLVGQADAGDTAAGERVRLETGAASDVVGQHTQTAFRVVADKVHEEAYSVTLRNHKPMAVTVDVVEHPAGDWSVTEQSTPGTRVDANELAFQLAIPASGEAKLTYTLRIRDPK